MIRGTRVGGAALAAALLLTGCAGDVDGELRRGVADLTDAANARDADGVRDSAESLIARTQDAVRDNDISPQEGARILELATLLRDRAGVLEPAEPPPAPPPTQEPEPEEEEETEEPSPSPTPRPTSPPPSPQPSASPTPSPPPAEQTLLPEVPAG